MRETGRTTWRRAGAAWTLVAALALIVAGCGGDDGGGGGSGSTSASGSGDGAQPATVTVGTLPTANAAPMYLGMKKGFFREEGLTVKPQVGEGGGSLIAALNSNAVQFAFVGVIPMVTAVSKDVPIKVVAMSDAAGATARTDWQTLMVGKGSPIKDVSDLADKTIAVNALRGVSEVMIKNSLEKQGVDPDSIKLIEVPFPDMPAALGQKQVDAALATEPFLSAILADGGRQIDAPFVNAEPKVANGVYVAANRYIGENGDVVDRFSRAMKKSVDYAATHEQEVRDIIPTYTQIPAAAAAKIRLPTFTSQIDNDSIQLNAEMAKKYGVIEEIPSMDDMVR
jgi:NitT/TauT family transport system substrate-binding protein